MPFHFNYIILRIGTGTYVPKAKRVLHNKAELYVARCADCTMHMRIIAIST